MEWREQMSLEWHFLNNSIMCLPNHKSQHILFCVKFHHDLDKYVGFRKWIQVIGPIMILMRE